MTEILLIEDDKGLREGIAIGLGSKEYHFTGCTTLAQARETVRKLSLIHILLIPVICLIEAVSVENTAFTAFFDTHTRKI